MFTVLVKPNDGITVPVVAATNSGVYALKADGTVWTWGNTYDGSTSSTVNRTSPVRVVKNVGKDSTTYLENIKHIAAGPTHMLAVDTDGQVWALGNNANGKLGIGGTSTAYTPTLVKTSSTEILSGVERVAAGARNSAALAQDGVVYVWGDNTYGQRGIEAKNSKYSQYASFTVKGASAGDNADGALNDFIDITIGDTFISALRRDGNVFSWGSGSYGQIGKGFFTEALAPTQAVNGESASSTAYLRNIVKISAGAYHNIALSDDSSVYAWGRKCKRSTW